MSTEQKQISVSVDVSASPEVVWSLLSDLARMGEWSPECTGITWAGAAPGPAGPSVGAVFKGKNKIGIRRWSTKGTIVASEPNQRIAWDIAAIGLPVSRWGYTIEPSASGCRVTETWDDKRGGLINFVGPLTTGVKDRVAHNEAGMRETLNRLKTAAEARAASA
jgi:uncharacterized protein YndB with AHSA1/START domain